MAKPAAQKKKQNAQGKPRKGTSSRDRQQRNRGAQPKTKQKAPTEAAPQAQGVQPTEKEPEKQVEQPFIVRTPANIIRFIGAS